MFLYDPIWQPWYWKFGCFLEWSWISRQQMNPTSHISNGLLYQKKKKKNVIYRNIKWTKNKRDKNINFYKIKITHLVSLRTTSIFLLVKPLLVYSFTLLTWITSPITSIKSMKFCHLKNSYYIIYSITLDNIPNHVLPTKHSLGALWEIMSKKGMKSKPW